MGKQSIWIAGAGGRLGSELVRILKEDTEHKIVATDKDVDVTDMRAVEQAMDVYRPSVVINCASLSNVAYCEEHLAEAFKVNALGARNLAAVTRQHGSKLIQLSTDDIFNGNLSGQMNEFDTPAPTTVYGKSKLAGENFVRELNPKHLIIRSSWVYGVRKDDYFAYVSDKAAKGESFTAPVDQISTPTSAVELANFLCEILEHAEYGIYHASCEGSCSRYEFAQAILKGIGVDASLVSPVTLGEEGGKCSTLLENLMMKMTGVYQMPAWEDALTEHIASMNEK